VDQEDQVDQEEKKDQLFTMQVVATKLPIHQNIIWMRTQNSTRAPVQVPAIHSRQPGIRSVKPIIRNKFIMAITNTPSCLSNPQIHPRRQH